MLTLQDWTRIFHGEADGLLRGHKWILEFDNSIIAKQAQPGWKEYIRSTSARFQCTNCRRTWPSNRVMVVFHMTLTNDQGRVKIRRYRQECKKCSNAPMVEPDIEVENVTTLMKNLVKKIRMKCYGEELDQGFYDRTRMEVKSPHEPAHCEGCRAGICTRD